MTSPARLLHLSCLLLHLSHMFFTSKCIPSVMCLQDQSSSLLLLKAGFSSSNKLVSWRLGSNCCDWEGITCDTQSGRVTGIDISSRNLSGKVVSSLFRLSSLRELNMANNQFDGMDIPSGFEKFASLSTLNLSNAGFARALPMEIFQIRNLNVLDLSGNRMLSGVLPDFPTHSPLKILMMSHTNLSSYLPESISNLKYLVKLDLSNCQFSGVIPLSIGNSGLHNLIFLDLSNNSFSGPISRSLLSLPALQELHLEHNQFSGQLPMFPTDSYMLRILDLSSNLLEGPIPTSLFKLSGLEFLGLASNNFSGTMKLDSLKNLRNLTYLDVSNNRLSIRDGHGSSSLPFPKLSTLKLASCNLTKIPHMLRDQDRVAIIDLSNNRIRGGIPEWIWEIGDQTLASLNLSHNSFTHVRGSMPDYFTSSDLSPIIVDLHSNMLQGPIPLPPRNANLLDYSNNNLSSSIPPNISMYLNSTIFLSLASNSITGHIPQSICNASSLQFLDLSYNLLTGSIPACILESNRDLIVLNLRGNQLQGPIPQNISEGCSLKTMSLNGNHLEGQVPPSLVNCKKLEVIDLGNNCLKGVFPFALGYIFPLRILVLRSNSFYGTIQAPPGYVHNNFTFTLLQILDLSSNNFSGSLPYRCFENLQAMMLKPQPNSSVVGHFVYPQQKFQGMFYQDTVVVTNKGRDTTLVKILTIYKSIDFSNNRFDGDLPEDLGDLQSLCVLNLSHNVFTGHIPSTFGNLMQLESLDLSGNRLSSQIPQELSLLTFLAFLNLSSNNLVGPIPQGNQFSTFSNVSFANNEGLCGIPLSKSCEATNDDRKRAPSVSTDDPYDLTDIIEIALSIGIGYGVGISLVIIIQITLYRKRKKS